MALYGLNGREGGAGASAPGEEGRPGDLPDRVAWAILRSWMVISRGRGRGDLPGWVKGYRNMANYKATFHPLSSVFFRF